MALIRPIPSANGTVKEVLASYSYSGSPNGFLFANEDQMYAAATAPSSTKINGNSKYFTYANNVLTAISDVDVVIYHIASDTLAVPTVTEQHLSTGDTITFYTASTNGSWIVVVK